MRNNPEGGLVVFITSDTDFLKEVNTVTRADGFSAELLYWKEGYTTGPGMRENVDRCYEWMDWLRGNMSMPQLQMHHFSPSERESPLGMLLAVTERSMFCAATIHENHAIQSVWFFFGDQGCHQRMLLYSKRATDVARNVHKRIALLCGVAKICAPLSHTSASSSPLERLSGSHLQL